jgi:hypothetical protein
MTTIVHCLRPVDKLAIVTFSGRANVNMKLVNMDENGKRDALRVLDSIRPNGSTNLWDGLDTSLGELDGLPLDYGTNMFSLLFTDGEPNINPVRGILNEFISRNAQHNLTSALHIFGYGYSLDSALLTRLAEHGGGIFSHIPDQTMCNTVFINFLSYTLATVVNKVKVGSTNFRKDWFSQFDGYNADSCMVSIGAVQEGQPRNILLPISTTDPSIKIPINVEYNGQSVPYTLDFEHQNPDLYDINFMNSYINMTIKDGLEMVNLKKTHAELEKMYDMIYGVATSISNELDANIMKAILRNIKSSDSNEGQLCKAFSNEDWFNRWGIHYLRYFVRSHQLQVCSNFKDTSLQHYGGKLFRELRMEIEDIFRTIPVPKPSRSNEPFRGNFQQSTYSQGGPCIAGDGTIEMVNGQLVRVSSLKKGDQIKNNNGDVATIVCVIKTNIRNGYTDMLSIGKLKVTPWHPIKIDGKWKFPADVGVIEPVKCDYVYNFVLDRCHVMTVSGIDVITLGHGLNEDPVLKHPFFGTDKVVNQLKTHQSWDNGLILLDEYKPNYEGSLIASLW